MVIYGRRMTGLIILTGYMLGALLELIVGGGFAFDVSAAELTAAQGDTGVDALNQTLGDPVFVELGVIGYIIPGLIALWFNRQGIMQTLAALIVTSVLVRLVLIVLVPDLMIAYDAQEVSFIEMMSRLLRGGSN